MDIHQYCEEYPPMTEDEFTELCSDIQSFGLLEPITTYKNQIIDGRHRFKACQLLNVKPVFSEWSPVSKEVDKELACFIHSKNEARRHLSLNQRALKSANAMNLRKGKTIKYYDRQEVEIEAPEEHGKQPIQENQKPQVVDSKQKTNPPTGGSSTKQTLEKPVSAKEAAKKEGISERSVQRAKTILDHGSEKLQKEVFEGKKSLAQGEAEALGKQPPTKKPEVADEEQKQDATEVNQHQDKISIELGKTESLFHKVSTLVSELQDQAEIAITIAEKNQYLETVSWNFRKDLQASIDQLRYAKSSFFVLQNSWISHRPTPPLPQDTDLTDPEPATTEPDQPF